MAENTSARGSLILGIAIVVAALIGAGAVAGIKRASDDITVTGSAKRAVQADLAVWQLDVNGQAAAQLDAARIARDGAASTHDFLVKQGFPDSAITVRAPMTMAINEYVNGNMTNRILGYRVTVQVEVRTREVAKIATLAGDVGALLGENIPVVAQAPQYLYAKLPELRGPLLAEATRDAKSRAEEILKAVGSSVGRIKAVRVGVFQVTKRNSTEVNDYGMYDTSDREKEVTSVVRVTFALK